MAKKILVVDDEKLIVKGIRFSLEQDDMEVDCAYDGEEALEKVRANPYDIVLLDIMLPKLTGLEVCQQIREFSNVPVIMLTAKGDDMDKILGLEYGADDYITKPFNILEVKARIKAIMRRTATKSDPEKKTQVLPSITGMPPAAAMAFIYVPLTERTGTPIGLKRMPGVTKINFFILIRLNFFPGAENTPHCAQRRPGPGAP